MTIGLAPFEGYLNLYLLSVTRIIIMIMVMVNGVIMNHR